MMNRQWQTDQIENVVRHGTHWQLWRSALLVALVVMIAPLPDALAAATEEKDKMTDSGITRAVDTDLLMDPSVSSRLIDVRTIDGVVTLSGSVDNLLSKERAVRIASSIRGVQAVVDNVKVRPVERSDREIERAIEAALLRDPAADSYEVQVKVKDGMATLSGEVESWQEKQLSAQIAKGVRGVKGVHNEIDYTYESDRPDREIQADIQRRLGSDIWVDARFMTVTVEDGKVKLSGSVGSAVEKTYATADGWVAGAKQVDASAVTIDPDLRDSERRKSRLPQVKSDQEIALAIKNAFHYDPRVFCFNPTVEVSNGVVTLTGVVENLKARNAATADAQNTLGVWRVVNLLKVRDSTARSDSEIAKDIRQALYDSPFVDRFDVKVRVVNQEAYLTGLANSPFEKAEAGRLAEGVKGVVEVNNNVGVQQEMYANERLYNYPYWGYYLEHNRPLMLGPVSQFSDTDALIKQDIENHLFWSPFVDSEDITVTVSDGVATLAGKVDNRMERGAAIDNAYQGGALAVNNQLKLIAEPSQ